MGNELVLNKKTVCITEKVVDKVEEIPLERDFVLPDYFPDVFRVLRCTVSPRPDSQTVSADKLTFGVTAVIRVLYLTEGSRRVNCAEQEVELSRSVELPDDCPSPEVRIDLSARNVSCRAKGSRRLDVRATVCAAVEVCCTREKSIVTDGSGCGVQLRRRTVTCPVKRLCASKRITVIQQTSLPEDKPAVGTVLRTGCVITRSEHRIVAGKLAVKGEAELQVLYSCIDKAGEDTVQDLRFTLPFSQIIDMDGVDESFNVNARVTPAACSLIPGSGEEKTAEWELALNVFCTAEKMGTEVGVTDVFSTEYECCPDETVEISAGQTDCKKLTAAAECTLTAPDGTVGMIYDCCAECSRPAVSCENGRYKLTGSVGCAVMGEGSEGGIFCCEGQCVYEAETELPDCAKLTAASAEVTGCSYYLGEGGSIRIRADVRIECMTLSGGTVRLVGSIKTDEESRINRDNSCALRLCRCGENEDLWDIAKRYHTSVEAVMEDNELTDDSRLGCGKMIVIRSSANNR